MARDPNAIRQDSYRFPCTLEAVSVGVCWGDCVSRSAMTGADTSVPARTHEVEIKKAALIVMINELKMVSHS